jgi:hypothetical protein
VEAVVGDDGHGDVGREGVRGHRHLPQAGAEEASARLEAAARKERIQERTPRVD